MSTEAIRVDKKACMKWAIVLLICATIAFIPANEQFTSNIKLFTIISLFGIMCFAFELMSTTIIALIIPMFYWVFKVAPLNVVFQPWTQSTVWMMLGGVMIGACYEKTGIFARITYWFLAKTGGSINALIYGLTIFAVFGAYTGMGAQTIVYFVLIYGFCKALNLEQGSNLAAVLFYVAYIAGAAAGIILAYDPMFDLGMNMTKMFLAEVCDVSIFNVTYYTYAFHNLIFMPAIFAMVWLGTKILKIETRVGSQEYFQERYAEMGPMTLAEKKCIGSACLLFVLFVTQRWTGLDVGLCMMLASIWCFLPVVGYCDNEDLKNINYSVPLFVAGTMAIGTVANAVGAGQLVANIIIPFLGSSPFGNALSIFVIGYILNLVLTPFAAVAVVSGPLALAVYQMGINPIPVMYTLVQGLNNVLFPYEGVYFLLMFSFGYMTMKQFIKLFTGKTILMLLWLLLLGVPWWMMLGLYQI